MKVEVWEFKWCDLQDKSCELKMGLKKHHFRCLDFFFLHRKTSLGIQAPIIALRWPNTVFARAKAFKKQTCRQESDHFIYWTLALSVLFLSIIERSVLMTLVFHYKDMLEKVTMQRTKQSAFVCYRKNPVKVAEHSFGARSCWCDSAHAQGLPSIQRSFYLLNACSIFAIFFVIERSVLMVLVFIAKVC